MNVGELIEALSKVPPSHEVVVNNAEIPKEQVVVLHMDPQAFLSVSLFDLASDQFVPD
jgi:hypothetical protein